MTLLELQNSLNYYVIDADYCECNHIEFNDVLYYLKKDVSNIVVDIFTDTKLIEDINTIKQLNYNN